MRLIDADALLLHEYDIFRMLDEKYDKEEGKANRHTHARMKTLVKRAPTVYDIDRVIEQLEKEQQIATPDGGEIDQVMVSLEAAIAIVQNGGKRAPWEKF